MTATDTRFAPFVTSDPEVLGGMPVLKRTRVRLETVLQCYEDGAEPEQVAEWYQVNDLGVLHQIKRIVEEELSLSH